MLTGGNPCFLSYQSNTAKACLDTMLSIQPKESAAGSGETRESVVSKQAAEMLAKLPANYLPHEVNTSQVTHVHAPLG